MWGFGFSSFVLVEGDGRGLVGLVLFVGVLFFSINRTWPKHRCET